MHLDAVDDFEQMFLCQMKLLHHWNQCLCNGVLRFAAIDCCDLCAPPVERGARRLFIRTFVHHVIHFAAKSIQRGDGAAFVRRQEHEAVVEAGTAGGGFVMAVLVWCHFLHLYKSTAQPDCCVACSFNPRLPAGMSRLSLRGSLHSGLLATISRDARRFLKKKIKTGHCWPA